MLCSSIARMETVCAILFPSSAEATYLMATSSPVNSAHHHVTQLDTGMARERGGTKMGWYEDGMVREREWYEKGNGTRKENRTLHFRTRQSQQTAEVYLLPARRQHFSIAAQTKRHLYGPGATLRHRNHQHRHQHPALLHFVVRRQQPPLHPHRMLQRPPGSKTQTGRPRA